MEHWFLLRSGKCDSAYNMAMDEGLLEHSSTLGRPVVRFYGWNEPAATFGYFQKYSDIERWTHLRPLIRRPTGGGLVPHDKDWTYSLVFPPGHEWYQLRAEESYRRVHEWISAAFERLRIETQLAPCCVKEIPGQCFAGAEKFDLLFQGQKIAGAAQRRNKFGLLIQGSVQSHPQEVTREQWEHALCQVARESFHMDWIGMTPPQELSERVEKFRGEKYSREEFNRRR